MLILGLITYKQARENIEHNQWVSQAYQVLLKADQLLTIAQDNEAGSRGYLITGDSTFFTPFLTSQQLIEVRLQELKELTGDNPAQQARIDSLQVYIQRRIDFSALTIRTRSNEGYEAAAKMVASGEGRFYMDEVREMIREIQQDIELRKLKDDHKKSTFMLTFFILLSSAFLVLIFAFLIIRNHIIYRGKLEKQIRKINLELAKRVKEKTKEVIEKEKRYHFVLDNMLEGAMILGFNWEYLYINNAAIRQGKFTAAELNGHTLLEKYPELQETEMFQALNTCMQDRTVQYIENEYTYPGNKKVYLEFSIQPVPEGIFVLSMDISERKRREKDREQYINELQEVLYKISHEMRQPIVQILGLSSLINFSLSHDDFRKLSVYMKQSASTLDDYTRELSAFVSSMKINSEN